MKLKSLTFNNFRQFYGKQTIEFSTDDVKNVTIIHGENGAGKTALLNAFKWCLYDKTDFDTNDVKSLLSERLIAESFDNDILNMSVELKFDHEKCNFSVKREEKYKKITDLEVEDIGSTFHVSYVDKNGQYHSSNNPQTQISQILPEDMHSYFFFNGERIDKLAESSSANDIKNAITTIMGIQIMERAEEHMLSVIRIIKKDMKKFSNEDLNKVIDEENKIDDDIKSLKEGLSVNKNNLIAYKDEIQIIETSLEDKKEVSGLQKERKKLQNELSDIKSKIEDKKVELKKEISSSGFHAFCQNLINDVSIFLEDKRNKKELPSNIKEQFVNDLLEDKICICGRSLLPGTEHYKKVTSYLNQTVTDDIETSSTNTFALLTHMKSEKNKLKDHMELILKDIDGFQIDRNTKNERIGEISSLIGSTQIENIDQLEARLNEYRQKYYHTEQKLITIENDIIEKKESGRKLKEKRTDLEQRNEAAKVYFKQLKFAEETKRVISELYESLTNKVRLDLSRKVDTVFRSIIKKEFWAEISEDFALTIYKKVGGFKTPVSHKSTGENQVTSLSFISSIVNICKENLRDNQKFSQGGIFPIVMDSPFGALDPEYRSHVAEMVPELAEQVILMVSDSQWSTEVEEKLKSKIGSDNSLFYYTPNPKKDNLSKTILQSDKYEYTEIQGESNVRYTN